MALFLSFLGAGVLLGHAATGLAWVGYLGWGILVVALLAEIFQGAESWD